MPTVQDSQSVRTGLHYLVIRTTNRIKCRSRVFWTIWDAFTKCPKANIIFVYMFICLPVRPFSLNNSSPHWMDFYENFHFSTFRKYAENIQNSPKSDKNNRYSTCRPIYIYDNISLILYSMRNVSDEICKGIETHFKFNNTFEIHAFLWDNVEKYDRARRATDGHSALPLHAGYLRLQGHSESVVLITFLRQ
jgi:hypothetical protein